MRTFCGWGAGDYFNSPTGSGGWLALLYNLIFLPEAEPDPAGEAMSVDCFRVLTALSAKA